MEIEKNSWLSTESVKTWTFDLLREEYYHKLITA